MTSKSSKLRRRKHSTVKEKFTASTVKPRVARGTEGKRIRHRLTTQLTNRSSGAEWEGSKPTTPNPLNAT